MRKRQNTLCIALLILAMLLSACGQSETPAAVAPTPVETSPAPTPVSQELVLDLPFNGVEDMAFVMTFSSEGQYQVSEEDFADGALHMAGDGELSVINVIQTLEPGMIAHFRTRSSGVGPCYTARFGFFVEGQLGNMEKAILLDSCPENLYRISSVDFADGGEVETSLSLSGSVPVFADEWVDTIFWLTPDGETIYYFITNPDDTVHVSYGAVALPEEWQSPEWFLDLLGFFEPEMGNLADMYVDVDFIRVARGDLDSYLYSNVPAYLENQALLDTFLAQAPQSFPISQGENPVEADAQEVEQDSPQNESNDYDRLLTWPDPAPVLPYLLRVEDLEKCIQGEDSMYGVELHPYGYTFVARLRNLAFEPYYFAWPTSECVVEQRLTAAVAPVTLPQMREFLRLKANIRSGPNEAPINFVYKNEGGINLMLVKENLINEIAVGVEGNALAYGNTLIEASTAQLPEGGLPIPDLVAAPSDEMDEEAAEVYLDEAWLMGTDNKRLEQYEWAFFLVVRLRAPVEKLEAAAYHPASETYLSYYWTEQPEVGEDLVMMDDLNTVEGIEGFYLIRIWADGALVAELPVEVAE